MAAIESTYALYLVRPSFATGQFTVGSQSSAITVGKIVDDEATNDFGTGSSSVLLFDVGQVGIHGGYFGSSVT